MREQESLALEIIGDGRRKRSREVMAYSALLPDEKQLEKCGLIKSDVTNGIRPTPKGWVAYWRLKAQKMLRRTFN